jgi:hypothetical protein
MKNLLLAIALTAVAASGCEFAAGAGTGALATGAGYEIQAHRQLNRLEDDYKSGKIDREEYEKRKQQIERGSLIY